MADLTEGIQNALAYIEANLTEELEVRAIAKKAFCRHCISNESLEQCVASVSVSISAAVG